MSQKIKVKLCPFCCDATYEYHTRNGLIRHVLYFHATDGGGQSSTGPSKVKQLRIDFIDKAGLYHSLFIDVKNWREVETFLQEYIDEVFNPSKKRSKLWNYVNRL